MALKKLLLWLLYFVCSGLLLSSGFHLNQQEARVSGNIAETTHWQANILTAHESIALKDRASARFLFTGSIFELAYLTLRTSKRSMREWAKDFVLAYQKRQRQRLEKKGRRAQTNQLRQMKLLQRTFT